MDRILSFPASLGERSNPYFATLESGLARFGYALENYRPLKSNPPASVLHIHWIERMYQSGPARRTGVLSYLGYRQLLGACRRVKERGGRVVWTAHNLAPHDGVPPAHRAGFQKYAPKIMSEVDAVICMSASIEDEIRAGAPEVAHAQFVVAPHPHYRDVYTEWRPRERILADLGLDADARLATMLGYVRRYKGVIEFLKSFQAVRQPDEFALVAGLCRDEGLKAQIEAAAAEAGVLFVNEALSDEDLTSYYKASNLSVFNFSNILNSGSVVTALSLDAPCLAPAKGAIGELAAQVGPDWLQTFDGPLTPERLRAALDHSRAHAPTGRPDLALNEPVAVARAHLDAYGLAPKEDEAV
ncbi:MAG: glycosyltransferase [Pseudomonadota bacterium]